MENLENPSLASIELFIRHIIVVKQGDVPPYWLVISAMSSNAIQRLGFSVLGAGEKDSCNPVAKEVAALHFLMIPVWFDLKISLR